MKFLQLRLAIVILLIPVTTYGYPPDQAKTNLAHEFAECASFYGVGQACMASMKHSEGANLYENLYGKALEQSIKYSDEEVTMARLMIEMEEMKKKTKGRCDRISVLFDPYLDKCKAMLEDPGKRLNYWKAK